MPDTDLPRTDSPDTETDVDALTEPGDADAADLTGASSDEFASAMHEETDEIAEQADPEGPGHGPTED